MKKERRLSFLMCFCVVAVDVSLLVWRDMLCISFIAIIDLKLIVIFAVELDPFEASCVCVDSCLLPNVQ